MKVSGLWAQDVEWDSEPSSAAERLCCFSEPAYSLLSRDWTGLERAIPKRVLLAPILPSVWLVWN